MSRFADCLAETLKHEGGWANHPRDPGGATMKGVTQKVYDGWREARNLPKRSVRHIEDAELGDIYRRQYWDAVRADELPAGVDLAAFDFAVNSGPARAAKSLQRTLGLNADGHIGAATLAAVGRVSPEIVIADYMAARRAFLRGLSTYGTFGRGWMRRCDEIEDAALSAIGPALARTVPVTPPAADDPSIGAKALDEPTKPPVTTEVALTTAGATGTVTGAAQAIDKIAKKTDPTHLDVLLAFMSEPLVLMAVVTFVAAFTTFLWRRKYA